MKKLLTKVMCVLVLVALSVSLASCSMAQPDNSRYKTGVRDELSEGVSNMILNALYMYNTFWTPVENVSAWSTSKVSTRQFVAGHTYRGIPYGQPVHKGAYVGSVASVSEFAAAAKDPASLLYTDRGENTYYYTTENGPIKYSPYYSNDCSGFVSAAMGIKRHTTRDIGGNPDLFPVKSRNVLDAKPGDLINSHEGGHVIMVLDVVYDNSGSMKSIVTIEQTPDIIVIRSYGEGGTNGSIAKLQERMTSGSYYLCRYKYIDDIKLMDGAPESLPKTVNYITAPSSIFTTDAACEGKLYVDFSEEEVKLEGFTISAESIDNIEYSVNGGSYKDTIWFPYYELTTPAWGFSYLKDNAVFSARIPTADIPVGSVIKIRAKVQGGTYDIGELTVERAPLTVSFDACIDSYGIQFGSYNVPTFEEDGSLIMLNGWCTADDIIRFEVRTDKSLWYPLGQYFREDVFDYKGFDYPSCVECNAFNCGIDVSVLSQGQHKFTLRAVRADGYAFEVFSITAKNPGMPAYVIGLIIGGTVLAVLIAGCVTVIIIMRKRKARKKAENALKCEDSSTAAVTEEISVEASTEASDDTGDIKD